MGSVSRASSGEVDEGLVVRSIPAAGERVATGTEVELVVSTGTEEPTTPGDRGESRAVPDVMGLPLQEALDTLTERGFHARIEEVAAQGRPPGIIASQAPEPGIRHPVSGTVTIVVTLS